LNEPEKQLLMSAWMCKECGYLYDPAEGDPDSDIKAGTSFEKVSEEWACPVCYAQKITFEALL
jgi:rubredoxin